MWTLALVVSGSPACVQPSPPQSYPLPDADATCADLDGVCDVELVDLGGGAHENAYHIVFAGDGFGPEAQPAFVARVTSWLAGLQSHPDGFVAWAPELFHFWRLDVVDDGTHAVDDADLTNTVLGAHLRWDGCLPTALIHVDEVRLRRIFVHAAQRQGVPVAGRSLHFVTASHLSTGRANATIGAHTRMSSLDGVDVLRHELGHALFGLGDEYVEHESCPLLDDNPALRTLFQPETHWLATANVSRVDDDVKWQGHVDGTEPGGCRWPCYVHPEEDCLMGHGHTFCPVCRHAIEEHLALRQCQADVRAPTVALTGDMLRTPGGSDVLLGAMAFDERSWVTASGLPSSSLAPVDDSDVFFTVPLQDTLAVSAEAVDDVGNVGHATTVPLASLRPRLDAVTAVHQASGAAHFFIDSNLDDGWLVLDDVDGARIGVWPLAAQMNLALPIDLQDVVATVTSTDGKATSNRMRVWVRRLPDQNVPEVGVVDVPDVAFAPGVLWFDHDGCAPVVAYGLRTRDGDELVRQQNLHGPRSTSDCARRLPLVWTRPSSLKDHEEVVAFVVDAFGRTVVSDEPVLSYAGDADSCWSVQMRVGRRWHREGEAPLLVGRNDKIGLEPAGVQASFFEVTSTVGVRELPMSWPASTLEAKQLRPMVDATVWAAWETPCDDVQVVQSQALPLRWDVTAPVALGVYTAHDRKLQVGAVDDDEVVWMRVTTESGRTLALDAPPWVVEDIDAPAQVLVADAAGNRAEVLLETASWWWHPRTFSCEGGQP